VPNNASISNRAALAMLFSYVILLAILGGIVWLILPNVMDSIRDLQSTVDVSQAFHEPVYPQSSTNFSAWKKPENK